MDIGKKVADAFIERMAQQPSKRGYRLDTLGIEFFLGAAAACEDNSEEQKILIELSIDIATNGYHVIEQIAEKKYKFNS